MDANTIVRVYDTATEVVVPSAAFFTDQVNAAAASAQQAAGYLTQVASDAAIAAAAAALITGAAINFTVDASLVVRPEDHGGANAVGLAGACAAAAASAGVVALSPGATYLIDREVVVPTGVAITGPRSASLKLPNQVSTTLTGSFTSGTGAKTFTVADASAFVVGQTVMFANTTTHVVSPNDSFSHAGRQISAIAGNTVTIAAGPTVSAHAAGDVMASTAHLLRLQGSNNLRGFTIDGNAANNTYAHWITSALIAQEGDKCRLIDLGFKDTPSDAFVVGTSASDLIGSWAVNCDFDNIGGNGVHYGQCRKMVGFGNRFKDGNMRFLLPVEQGGGAAGRGGHQDGAYTYSNDVGDGTFVANHIENWICGFGAMGTTATSQINDDTIISSNTIKNCLVPIEVTSTTKRVIFTQNKCAADYPFATTNGTPGASGNRWISQTAQFLGDVALGRIQNAIVTNNIVKNGVISLDRVYNAHVTGNIVDNRMTNSASNNTGAYHGIQLYNYEACTVKGNTVLGGYFSLWLQNSNLGANYSGGTIIEGNLFLGAYQRGLAGSLTSPSTFEGTILRGNTFRVSSLATQEDGTTALTYQAAWRGIGTYKGLQIESNRVDYDIAGAAAYDTSLDAATAARRCWNVVNGIRELPSAAANDAAAATANVPVGGFYINGSVVQQRVV